MRRASPALSVILSRRSIREFSARKVPPSLVDLLVEAGRRAPSPHDSQPWLFVVISKKGDRETLGLAMREAYARHLSARKDPQASLKAEKAYRRTLGAPLLILICLDRSLLKSRATTARQRGEWIMATQGVAAAAENILLAAHAEGLGGCWRGAPLFCASAIRSCVGLRAAIEPQVLLELGFPGGRPRRKLLKPKGAAVREGIRRG